MGFGGISIWQLLIILVIVVLIFGTKKIRGMGGDLGSAIKSFKKAVKDDGSAKTDDDKTDEEKAQEAAEANKAVLEADPPAVDEQTFDKEKQNRQV